MRGGDQIGHWETHTKGIGAKLLQKMGFEPGKGLGKNLQGITTPVEARDRSTFDVLGRSSTFDQIDDDPEAEADRKNRKIRSDNEWKKTEQNTRRAKKVIKTADQIIAESVNKPWNEFEINNVKVIDMTGPEQRVLSGYHQISQSAFEEDNVNDLGQITDKEISENTHELKRESNRLNSLKDEIERLSHLITEESLLYNTIESLLNKIESLTNRFNDNDITIEEILEQYDNMKRESPLEFDSLKLHEILIPTTFPLIRQLIKEWKPLENANQFISLFTNLKRIMSTNEDAIYEMILWDIWMPIVRHHILLWPSIRQCDEIISFLESWRLLVPDWLFDNILEQIIIPSLQKEVEEWNPLTDTVPIHSWLHPWLPLMGDRSLEHIYDPIRHKLSTALTNWHPSDSSAKLILEPWKGVFSAGAMEAFLNINIVPKLELALQTLIINPHQQCLDVWHWVMSWQHMTSTPTMAALLDKHFFPKWLHVLYNWLSKDPDYNEVKDWYIGWKQMLSKPLVSYPSIADAFNRALQMMECSIKSNGQMKPFNTFYSPAAAPLTANCPPRLVTNQTVTQLSFKEMIEVKAREHGILFVPVQHKQHSGKQVFKFGHSLIHIDDKVIFVLDQSNWVPHSLDALIQSNC